MINYKRKNLNTEKIVLAAVLTSIVVVLQVMAIVTRLLVPAFSINLVLVPIVIGAAVGGIWVGGWLGFVSGVAILISGDAAAFLAVDILGTIITVLLKGTVSGIVAAIVYKALERKNKYLAVITAAVACPLANTGIFVLGCFTFFIDTVRMWGSGMGYENAFTYVFLGMIGINFIIELIMNIVLSPTVVRLLKIREKE